MAWQYTIYAYPTLFAALASLAMAAYALRVRDRSDREVAVTLFAALSLAVAVWTGFATLKLVSVNPGTKLLAYRLLHVGSAATAPLLLLFALAYTDRHRWLRAEVVAGLFAVPVLFVLLLFLNPADLIVADRRIIDVGDVVVQRTDTGPAHVLLSAVYTRMLGLFTLGLIGYELYRQGRSYLPQAALLSIAILAPVTVGLLTEAAVPPFDQDAVNFVPASTAVSVVALGVAIWRYELLDLPPIAYRTAVRYSPDGVLVLDEDRRVVHANPRATSLLGDERSPRGQALASLLPTFDPRETGRAVVERQPSAGGASYLDVRAQPLERWDRRVGWVLVLQDVTERRRRERELEAFTGVVSHDLRQPMRTIEQYLELLEEHHGENLDGDGRELLGVARRNSARVQEMVSALREYSQIQPGEEPFEPVDCETLVAEVVEANHYEIDDRDATVRIEALPRVRGSRHLLHRLFQNLLANALEHAGDAPEIEISAEREGDTWRFAVTDDGRGIDPAAVDGIFEPFTRGPGADANGTGMGLAIAERIVDAHGGSIGVDSTPGEGTTAWFTLPAE